MVTSNVSGVESLPPPYSSSNYGPAQVLPIFDWSSLAYNSCFFLIGFNTTSLRGLDGIPLEVSKLSLGVATNWEAVMGDSMHIWEPLYVTFWILDLEQLFSHLATILPILKSSPGRKFFFIIEEDLVGASQDLEDELRRHLVHMNGTLHPQVNSELYFVLLNGTETGESGECLPTHAATACVNTFKLHEFYTIKSQMFFPQIPTGKSPSPINFDILNRVLPRRQNFQGVKIVGVAQNASTSKSEVAFEEISNGTFYPRFKSGAAVEMYWNFRDMLNFTEGAMVGSSVWIQDGKVAGLTYDLLANDSGDISISQITIRSDRATVLQFLQPTQAQARIKAMFTQPSLGHRKNFVLAPFTQDVWASIAVTWVLLILILTGIGWLGLFLAAPVFLDTDTAFSRDSYMWAICSICQKGWPECPDSFFMRGVFLTGALAGLLLYVAYSGMIVAVLSVEQIPVKTFRDLLDYKYLFVAHERSDTLQLYIERALIRHYNLSQPVLTTTTENEVKILLTSKKALLSYEDVFFSAVYSMNYTNNFLCKVISIVPADSVPQKSAMFVRRGSPFRQMFDYKVMMMKERGFIERYLKDYVRKTTPSCVKMAVADAHVLETTDVHVTFALLGTGMLLSCVILVAERLIGMSRITLEPVDKNIYL